LYLPSSGLIGRGRTFANGTRNKRDSLQWVDRREHARTRVWFPVELSRAVGGKEILTVCHDVSQTGILVSSPRLVEPGTDLKLTLRIPPGDPLERAARGHVVRSGANEDDPEGLWRYRIAIEFDEPIAELDGLLEEVAATSKKA
jgi:hypothetical protein